MMWWSLIIDLGCTFKLSFTLGVSFPTQVGWFILNHQNKYSHTINPVRETHRLSQMCPYRSGVIYVITFTNGRHLSIASATDSWSHPKGSRYLKCHAVY